jgi:DNA polymerase elongation subunit (family B)
MEPTAVCLQTITLHPDTRCLWVFGVDARGRSAAIRVTDFYPSLLILAPHGTEDETEILADEELVSFGTPDTPLVAAIESVYATPFIGFTGHRRDHLWRVVCTSVGAFHSVVKRYRDANTTMFHEDISMENQFLQSRGLSYQSWITVPATAWRRSPRDTYCAIEASTSASTVRLHTEQDRIPLLRKCYLHVQAVSRDGVLTNQKEFQPDASKVYDRVVAVSIVDASTGTEQQPRTSIFLTGPASPGTGVACFTSERELLEAVRDHVCARDPDDLFYFPDTVDTLEYIVQRYAGLTGGARLGFGRFRRTRPRTRYRRSDHVHRTRSVLNVVDIVKRAVGLSIEAFDLATVSCHGSLRKVPATTAACSILSVAHTNASVGQGLAGQDAIVKAATLAVTLLRALDVDGGMRMEFSNISRVSDTSLTDAVSRGEQARVYNKLVRFCKSEGFYVNRDATAASPVRFSVREHPPTFPDPPEHTLNLALRAECTRELDQLLQSAGQAPKRVAPTCDPFAETVGAGDVVDEADQAEGGNVMKPSPRFWGSQRVAVFDFASLYPSIMQAYNISYETLVFDPAYLDLPGVDYLYIPVNRDETVVVADVPGVIPKLLRTLVEARSDIKRRMKGATDPFRRSMYDKEQNSMKVLCNATYGFCGADGKGAMLAVKTVMYVVTAIGRYLQKKSSDYLAERYGIPTIYGDTDSVFVQVDTLEGGSDSSLEAVVLRAGAAYAMDGYAGLERFDWAGVVEHFRTVWSVDLARLDRRYQTNAYMYMIYRKLCSEVTALFRPQIVLEMENMCDNVWMGWVKKHYCYRMWDPSHPARLQKIKITGMPVKKREYAPWVRAVLMHLTELLLGGRAAEVEPYLSSELQRMAAGGVPVDELRVSRSYQGMDKYKHMRQPHLQVVLKMEARTRSTVPPNSRVLFVVLAGDGLVYTRTETPEHAREHDLPLDYAYYLRNQLYRPVRNLLTYHPEVRGFESMFANVCRGIEMKRQCVRDVQECTRGNKYRRLSLRDATSSRRKLVPQATRVTRGPRDDPFSRFRQPPVRSPPVHF